MKISRLVLSFAVLLSLVGRAQSVTFTSLPANGQLFPRNAASVGVIPISGRANVGQAHSLGIKLFRQNQLVQYRRVHLTTTDGVSAPFSTTLTFPAELAQYRIQVYARRYSDSVLVANRERIVAGDAYVINGQSNAAAFIAPPEYTYQSEFIRTCGISVGETVYDPADTLWATGNLSANTKVT